MIVYVIDKDIHEKLEIRNPVDNYDMIQEMFKNDCNVIYRNGRYEMYNRTFHWYNIFIELSERLFELDNYIQENYVDIDIFSVIELPENSNGYKYVSIDNIVKKIKTLFYYERYYQNINMYEIQNKIDKILV